MRRVSTSAEKLLLMAAAGVVLVAMSGIVLADAPDLPKGLGSVAPDPGTGPAPPPLPRGLVTEQERKDAASDQEEVNSSPPVELGGFTEARVGLRLQDDPDQADSTVRDLRIQFELSRDRDPVSVRILADLLFDGVARNGSVDLESGDGAIDLREANILYRGTSWLDLKAGRQILTWGTGDLIFINDLFPKDWNSFFIGRDLEYLKAPSDSVKISLFGSTANLDIVYTPIFDADRYIDGRRISYYHPSLGDVVGRESPIEVDQPDDLFDDSETAVRLYSNLGSWEAAFYAYEGYWKSPNGYDGLAALFTFPPLTVFGASARGPVSGGIGSIETGYYDSRSDRDGSDPQVRNSEWRALIGYERELAQNLTGSFQYYLEQMTKHGEYLASLPPGAPAKDDRRHVVTLRLTRLAMNQNLRLSLFQFYSPSDEDGYLRLSGLYKVTDSVRLELGGNFFYGEDVHTFFGQFEDASNVYAGIRTGF